MKVKKLIGRTGWVTAVLLALVAIMSIVVRTVSVTGALTLPPDALLEHYEPAFADTDPESFEGRYDAHPVLTLVHILPGFLVMILGPLQFVGKIRSRHIQVHRWSGRIFVSAALVSGVAAMVITFVFPVFGSFTAPAAMMFFGPIFLFSVVKAYLHIRRREILQHREWMIRAFALALGVSTFRVLLNVFLIAGVSFPEAWETVVWLGFATNMVIAEVWINVTRPSRHEAMPAGGSIAARR